MKNEPAIHENSRIGEGSGEPGLVSVIIPTYNRSRIITQTIESVLRQTYRPVEIIIADDGSSDDTSEVVKKYGEQIRYFHQANAGVSKARNLGLRQARGEFIALLDSDDCWFPWKLQVQVEFLRRFPAVGMAWTDMAAVNDTGEIIQEAYMRQYFGAYRDIQIGKVLHQAGSLGDFWPQAPANLAGRPVFTGDLFTSLLMGNLVLTSTVLLRRDRLRQVGGFDESLLVSGEDYDFHWRTSREGTVGFLEVSSVLYRAQSPDRLTWHYLDMARNNLSTLLRRLEKDGGRLALPQRIIAHRLAHAYSWLGEEELMSSQGEGKGAPGHLWKSLRLWPVQPRTILLFILSLLPSSIFQTTRNGLRALRHMGRPKTATIS